MRRVDAQNHLRFVAARCCIICGDNAVQVAHVRHYDMSVGKLPTGMGKKPGDEWTLPLCWKHHLGPNGQHTRGELHWWREWEIDATKACLGLWRASGLEDAYLADKIIEHYNLIAKARL